MLNEIYSITDETYFFGNCTDYYEYFYDFENSKFDLIDMNGFSDSASICNSLYSMIVTLRQHNRDTLSEIVRYSYLYSLEYFIETSQIIDYGDCEEYDAEIESTFCLSNFDWDSKFSLWSSVEVELVCAKVTISLSDASPSDYCAYIISEVYEAYDYYTNTLLDSMVEYKMHVLSTELEAA